MCVALPGRVLKMNESEGTATVDFNGNIVEARSGLVDVKPGDLLFYYGRYAGQVGHVAIYIGNGKIIHAASERKGICVSDWKFVPIVAIRDVIPEELDH